MRRYEVRLVPREGWFHPFDQLVQAEPDVERVAIHEMHLVDDDVGQTLYEFRGDADRLAGLLDDLTCDASYQLDELDGRIFTYLLFEPNPTIRRLLAVHHNHRICLDPPQLFTADGDLVVTYFGTDDAFHEAMAAVPEEVTPRLERKSQFEPTEDPILTKLTAKQTEILRVAVDLGYYEVPREKTLADIGDELGLTSATVSEHLRKVEATLVTHCLSGGAADTARRPPRIVK